MTEPSNREYKINIDPRILELLGPSLYTNIYFVLAELIANSYDAGAKNVYILKEEDKITVEDDGEGMSYEAGDIGRYLNVAIETRTNEENSYTSDGTRKKMGRKGVGKLAALSVSEEVLVMSIKNGDKSGFVLSRHVGEDHQLRPLEDLDIRFQCVTDKGTSIVMTKPQYGLHKNIEAIKNNLLKIFPLVNSEFRIHIVSSGKETIIDSFDKEMIAQLGAVIVFGDEFEYLLKHFDPLLPNAPSARDKLAEFEKPVTEILKLKNKTGEEKDYELSIRGWIGAYRTTRDRKKNPGDFPDNFVSLLSNKKLGEYNILPQVGKNRLPEVYIVGQLHVDLFEKTELPDMALSNRQGYKVDDSRYQFVIGYVREKLLPRIVAMRETYADFKNETAHKEREERQRQDEAELRRKVDEFKEAASTSAAEKIAERFHSDQPNTVLQEIIRDEINTFLPVAGIKRRVDSQKKKILISHTRSDKSIADIVYKMLSFNGVPDDDIIYTNSENAACRIPEGENVFDYLRDFFVDSYSKEKIYVIYVTSNEMSQAWFAVTEVGAGWITKKSHKVFNVANHRPQKPLDIESEWQTSTVDGDRVYMTSVEFDKFTIKILAVCTELKYTVRSKSENENELKRLVSIVS